MPAYFVRVSVALALCWAAIGVVPAAAQSCPSSYSSCDNGGCCPNSAQCCPKMEEGCCDSSTPFCCGDGTCAASPAECMSGRTSCGDYDIPCGDGCAPAGSQCCDFDGHYCPPQGICTSETRCLAGDMEGPALIVVSSPVAPLSTAPERAVSPLRNPPDGTDRSCTFASRMPARASSAEWLTLLLAGALISRRGRRRARRAR